MTGDVTRGSAEAPEELPGPDARMALLVMPHQTNHLGTLFGGVALGLMDQAGFVAASRLSRKTVVTVSLDRTDFGVPVRAGELLEAAARVTAVGRTSLTVEVELWAENLVSGDRRRATSGRFVFVAVDEDGRPTPVRGGAEREP